jgi:hypothetical protein
MRLSYLLRKSCFAALLMSAPTSFAQSEAPQAIPTMTIQIYNNSDSYNQGGLMKFLG